MKVPSLRLVFALGFVLSLLTSNGYAQDESAQANALRWAEGEYTYRTIADHRFRGLEEWSLVVHPDGSRVMTASVNNVDAGVRFHMVHRVDASFRPIEVFVAHWVQGENRGTSHVIVDGDQITATVHGANGQTVQNLKVGDRFSVQPHPVSTDGWRGWPYDRDLGGIQNSTNFNISVAPQSSSPLLGTIHEETIEFIGFETITVPAGMFEAEHYRFRNRADIWVTPNDRIVVRYAYSELDREYILTTYDAGP